MVIHDALLFRSSTCSHLGTARAGVQLHGAVCRPPQHHPSGNQSSRGWHWCLAGPPSVRFNSGVQHMAALSHKRLGDGLQARSSALAMQYGFD